MGVKLIMDDKKHIERLYEVLEILEKDNKPDHAAAVKWAIFRLENQIIDMR